jgi:hypothetical protein
MRTQVIKLMAPVAKGVWTKSLARRTLRRGPSSSFVAGLRCGSQEVYRDPSSAADAG